MLLNGLFAGRPFLTFNSAAEPYYEGTYMVGRYRLAVGLPAQVPPLGRVTFGNGSAPLKVPLIPAAAALRALPRSPSAAYCTGGHCATLTVIGVALSTVTVPSSRGLAAVPAWDFTVQGNVGGIDETLDLFHLAVPPSGLTSLPHALLTQPRDDHYAHIASASLQPGGRRVILHVTLPPGQASPRVALIQTPGAVVVGAVIVNALTTPTGSGPRSASAYAAVITLSAPLGQRPLLEASTGLPVPVTDNR